MQVEATRRRSRRWCLPLLVFLFLYLPLDAFDADTCDTFDEGIVQVRVQAGEDALNPVAHPVVILPEVPRAGDGLRAVGSVSEPICTISVTRKPFSLPRSDDPHVP